MGDRQFKFLRTPIKEKMLTLVSSSLSLSTSVNTQPHVYQRFCSSLSTSDLVSAGSDFLAWTNRILEHVMHLMRIFVFLDIEIYNACLRQTISSTYTSSRSHCCYVTSQISKTSRQQIKELAKGNYNPLLVGNSQHPPQKTSDVEWVRERGGGMRMRE